MSYEWLGYSASLVVGLAGGVGATWVSLRAAQSAQREDRQQERRAELYVDVLEEVARVWVIVLESDASLVSSDPSDLPKPLTIDESFTLQARIDAFASRRVSELYTEVGRLAGSVKYWQEMLVQKNSVGLPWVAEYLFPPNVKNLSREQVLAKRETVRDDVEKARNSLQTLIRHELLTEARSRTYAPPPAERDSRSS